MTIMDIGLFSGFIPDEDSLIEVNLFLRTVPTNSMVFLPRFMITQGM